MGTHSDPLGVLGAHRFFRAGRIGTGILQLLALGGLGIWTLVDMIMVIVGALREKEGRVDHRVNVSVPSPDLPAGSRAAGTGLALCWAPNQTG